MGQAVDVQTDEDISTLESENVDRKNEITEMRAEMDQLSHDVSNPAMLFSCGYSASSTNPRAHVITYDRLIYEKSNMVERGFQNAGLNIQNGKFTAGSSGTYLV